MKKHSLTIIILVLAAFLYLKFQQNDSKIRNIPKKVTKILAFGDGITLGEASQTAKTYPSLLHKISNIPVSNHGQIGLTSRKAVEFLNSLNDPIEGEIVVMTLGVEDLLEGISLAETLRNLETVFNFFHEKGFLVAFGGYALPSTGDNWLMAVSSLCKEKHVLYIPDIIDDHSKDLTALKWFNKLDPEANHVIAKKVFENISQFL